MKTMKLPVGKHEIEVPTIRGLPIDTNMSIEILASKLAQVVGFLAVDWDGNVNKVIPIVVGSLDIEALNAKYFEPADKGTLSLFTYDASGKITLGMTQYTGEGDRCDLDNPVQRGEHIYITHASTTNR